MRAEELSESESALWEAFPAARTVDLGGHGEVRAEVIAALLLGARPPEPGRVPAVRLRGAVISGVLDLSFADVPYAALLHDCEFAEKPSLYGAHLRQVNLAGSRLPGLQAADARIDGLLWLKECRFDGQVTLVGAQVDGALSLRSARIDGARALYADDLTVSRDLVAVDLRVAGPISLRGAKVHGAMTLDNARLSHPGGVAVDAEGISLPNGLSIVGVTVDGELRLRDARIGRRLDLSKARLNAPGAVALDADRAHVEGTVELGGGLRAEGMVSLRSAVIGGTLVLNGSELVNPSGVSLHGHLLRIGSSLRASEGFRAHGQVYLDAAHVSGSIDLDEAHLSNPGGIALRASRAEITGGLFGKYGFVADGAIHLVDTRVGASVDLSGARLTAPGAVALKAHGISVGGVVNCCDGFTAEGRLSFAGARIGGELCFDGATVSAPGAIAIGCRQLRAVVLRLRTDGGVDGAVDVRHARVEVLRDDPAGWPPHSLLEGFAYETIEDPGSGADRLGWLDGVERYHPQPYEQLAAVYRRLGQDADARTVQLARQRRRRRTLPRWLAVWGFVQDWTVGYGYRPQRAVLWLAGLLLLGCVAFGVHHPPPLKAGEAPPFNPVLYTLDLLLPIIGFGQEDAFGPHGWQQWLAAALVASGWILATTIATGVSRVLSRH
ncbi:hypothetical protein NE236_29195 [Actinoallomurus purpureus]|uniref:hypothetical protein n=1 Tax=Actinoallomurus purpureus TaxID=478114 RepID=UPI0020921D35|nr:hypothetical protein [Actinoallomurus purpureus]MCO6009057.1 hypothetical protein [Actinoallomurus purpureus]